VAGALRECTFGTAAIGTFETYRDVRFSVAIKVKADVARTTNFGSD